MSNSDRDANAYSDMEYAVSDLVHMMKIADWLARTPTRATST